MTALPIVEDMGIGSQFWIGMASLFSVTQSPLYRYPYRSNEEGVRGDLHRVGADIAGVVDVEGEACDE